MKNFSKFLDLLSHLGQEVQDLSGAGLLPGISANYLIEGKLVRVHINQGGGFTCAGCGELFSEVLLAERVAYTTTAYRSGMHFHPDQDMFNRILFSCGKKYVLDFLLLPGIEATNEMVSRNRFMVENPVTGAVAGCRFIVNFKDGAVKCRPAAQLEFSVSEFQKKLGGSSDVSDVLSAPRRDSGDIAGTFPFNVVLPDGERIKRKEGAIFVRGHGHIQTADKVKGNFAGVVVGGGNSLSIFPAIIKNHKEEIDNVSHWDADQWDALNLSREKQSTSCYFLEVATLGEK